MTVVVTGASGHVGANLVRELRRRGRAVRAVIPPSERFLEGLDIEQVHADVRDAASLRAAFSGAEVLYHLAAVISIEGDRTGIVRAVNVDGVRHVAEAALACGVQRMVHCSSVRAFVQEPLDEPLDETRAKVTSPSHPAYDRSKAAGEAEVRKVIAKGLDAVIVNPTGIIGPCDYGPSRMGRFFLGLYDRTVPTLIEGGCNWVDVRDVVAAILEAEARGRSGENYLLAGHWQSTTDLAALVEQVVGVRPPAVTCPMWLARAVAPVPMVYARMVGREALFTTESLYALRANRHVVHDKATRELGYQPRPTLETVRDLYQWFASAGRLSHGTRSVNWHGVPGEIG
ncbi:MAG TPA: NAD-dependent epimerase/dehydratase family protein [Candidatus Dormibacteraeota bacterium]|nr:NAD-dependent epimerase/dehydratase family protein [Candidatus Dormibacteraeota bacterium]